MRKYESTADLINAFNATNAPKALSDELFAASTTVYVCTYNKDGEVTRVAVTLDGGLLHETFAALHNAIQAQLKTRHSSVAYELSQLAKIEGIK